MDQEFYLNKGGLVECSSSDINIDPNVDVMNCFEQSSALSKLSVNIDTQMNDTVL